MSGLAPEPPRVRFASPQYQYTFGPHAPGIRVAPGTRLAVVCPDSDNEASDGELLPPSRRQAPTGAPLFAGNPMAGPIWVEGAQPGHTLAVTIDAVHLDRAKGQTGLGPAHGAVPDHLLVSPDGACGTGVPRHLYQWHIDPAAGFASVTNPLGDRPLRVPLHPFVGCLGVCPEWGQAVSTLYAGPHGGNLDLPLLRPGTTVLLPVFHPGGLLQLGDIHAAQGDGELIGGGIETSGVIDCTVALEAGSGPLRLRDAQTRTAIGVAGEVRLAVTHACGALVQWLAGDLGLNRWDAYLFVSQTARLTMGQLNLAPYAVAATVPWPGNG